MDRINRLISSKEYRQHLFKNQELEKNRRFCHHNFAHMLTVARLTYLLLLERGERFIPKEAAYAAGLLHDLGRYQEYRDGTDHARQSAVLAEPLLQTAGFTTVEREMILSAIAAHRHKTEKDAAGGSPLETLLQEADRYSRLCYRCRARADCHSAAHRPTVKGLYY